MQEVVITGIGIVSPLGLGGEANGSALEARRSGVRRIDWLAEAGYPVPIGGEVPDFDPKLYIKPRKSLKVMSRETQLGFAAAEFAWADAGLDGVQLDPDRAGLVLGANLFRSELEELIALYRKTNIDGQFNIANWRDAMRELYPLWMLKYLPNMASCHIGIAKDFRGPINTIVEGDVSGLTAIIEAADVVARGHADLMIAGATGSMLPWIELCWNGTEGYSTQIAEPALACRPFDADRSGTARGEGSALLILESLAHAEGRGAKIRGRILGYGRRAESCAGTQRPTGQAIRQAILAALESGHVPASEVGHVNAHGLGTTANDAVEAAAIRDTLGDVPVTAPKSFIGNLGASSGAVELALSLLALERNFVPPTLNYETPDPACPVNVVNESQPPRSPAVLALNYKLTGQAVALLVSAEP